MGDDLPDVPDDKREAITLWVKSRLEESEKAHQDRIELLRKRAWAVYQKKSDKDAAGAVSDASPTHSTDVAPVRGNGRKSTAGVE